MRLEAKVTDYGVRLSKTTGNPYIYVKYTADGGEGDLDGEVTQYLHLSEKAKKNTEKTLDKLGIDKTKVSLLKLGVDSGVLKTDRTYVLDVNQKEGSNFPSVWLVGTKDDVATDTVVTDDALPDLSKVLFTQDGVPNVGEIPF